MSYIHYGTPHFNIKSWVKPTNSDRCGGIKPNGGLWASPVDPPFLGWKEWCEDNNYRLSSFDFWFTFELKTDSKILRIHSLEDLYKYRQYYSVSELYPESSVTSELESYQRLEVQNILFDKIIADGYDAIEVYQSEGIYWALYGWDVDSLLVLNPECIIECDSSKNFDV